jgi:hypothetical protein
LIAFALLAMLPVDVLFQFNPSKKELRMKRKLIKIGHPDEYMNDKIHMQEMAYPQMLLF